MSHAAQLCFALALWNGQDPILKERLFGLANSEGNHGEDVKEYYFCVDSTPTHSYMKWLYKYPQRVYPYLDLVETNRRRSRTECEYELLDTGIFNDNRYFDVFVEYAKASPEDVLIRITAVNRGRDAADLGGRWGQGRVWARAIPGQLLRRNNCGPLPVVTPRGASLGVFGNLKVVSQLHGYAQAGYQFGWRPRR